MPDFFFDHKSGASNFTYKSVSRTFETPLLNSHEKLPDSFRNKLFDLYIRVGTGLFIWDGEDVGVDFSANRMALKVYSNPANQYLYDIPVQATAGVAFIDADYAVGKVSISFSVDIRLTDLPFPMVEQGFKLKPAIINVAQTASGPESSPTVATWFSLIKESANSALLERGAEPYPEIDQRYFR